MTTLDQPRQRKLLSRRNVVIAGVLAAIVVAVGLVWFQPQKLFIDETVNEAVPQASGATAPSDAAEPAMSLEGTFSSLAHHTSGRAVVKELDDGSRVLRLEGFETENGPDLRVYLSAGPADRYGDDAIDLGVLKGNIGDQNYEIPADVDLDRYDTAVIWCRRFTVAFGAAELA